MFCKSNQNDQRCDRPGCVIWRGKLWLKTEFQLENTTRRSGKLHCPRSTVKWIEMAERKKILSAIFIWIKMPMKNVFHHNKHSHSPFRPSHLLQNIKVFPEKVLEKLSVEQIGTRSISNSPSMASNWKSERKKNYCFNFMMEIHLPKIKENISLKKTWNFCRRFFYRFCGLKFLFYFRNFNSSIFVSWTTVSMTRQQFKSTRLNNFHRCWITMSLLKALPTRWLVETDRKLRKTQQRQCPHVDERNLPENVDSNDSQHEFSYFPMRSLLFFRLGLGTDRLQLPQHESVEDEYQAQRNGEAQDEGVHGEGEAVGLHETFVTSCHVPALGTRRRRPHNVAWLFTFGVDGNRRRIKDNW